MNENIDLFQALASFLVSVLYLDHLTIFASRLSIAACV